MADYFTLVEFRDLPDMSDAARYPNARVEAAAAYFTTIVEREVKASMVVRTFTDTFDGSGTGRLVLRQPFVRSLTSVTVDGAVVSTSLLTFESAGLLRYLDGTAWSDANIANVSVTYTAGKYATCPPDVKDAVMWAVRDRLLAQSDQSGIDVRRTAITTDFGTTSYVLPGENRPTGYPDLDAVIASRRRGARPMVG